MLWDILYALEYRDVVIASHLLLRKRFGLSGVRSQTVTVKNKSHLVAWKQAGPACWVAVQTRTKRRVDLHSRAVDLLEGMNRCWMHRHPSCWGVVSSKVRRLGVGVDGNLVVRRGLLIPRYCRIDRILLNRLSSHHYGLEDHLHPRPSTYAEALVIGMLLYQAKNEVSEIVRLASNKIWETYLDPRFR